MSRFLGVGHSGVFSVDHMTTSEPWYIEGRARNLSDLASAQGPAEFGMFGIDISKEYFPDRTPEVKWVNWRWPRYECKCYGRFTLILRVGSRPTAMLCLQSQSKTTQECFNLS